MDLKEFIRKWKISGVLIAEKIGMPQGTFNNKFRPNQTVYRFTPEEEDKIKAVLIEMARDIYKEFAPPYNVSFKYEHKFSDELKEALKMTEPEEGLGRVKLIEVSLLPDGTYGIGYQTGTITNIQPAKKDTHTDDE